MQHELPDDLTFPGSFEEPYHQAGNHITRHGGYSQRTEGRVCGAVLARGHVTGLFGTETALRNAESGFCRGTDKSQALVVASSYLVSFCKGYYQRVNGGGRGIQGEVGELASIASCPCGRCSGRRC